MDFELKLFVFVPTHTGSWSIHSRAIMSCRLVATATISIGPRLASCPPLGDHFVHVLRGVRLALEATGSCSVAKLSSNHVPCGRTGRGTVVPLCPVELYSTRTIVDTESSQNTQEDSCKQHSGSSILHPWRNFGKICFRLANQTNYGGTGGIGNVGGRWWWWRRRRPSDHPCLRARVLDLLRNAGNSHSAVRVSWRCQCSPPRVLGPMADGIVQNAQLLCSM